MLREIKEKLGSVALVFEEELWKQRFNAIELPIYRMEMKFGSKTNVFDIRNCDSNNGSMILLCLIQSADVSLINGMEGFFWKYFVIWWNNKCFEVFLNELRKKSLDG
jgi:hypothetical protein